MDENIVSLSNVGGDSLPWSMSRIVRQVPTAVSQACESATVKEELFDEPLGAALHQVCEGRFSDLEWGALLEAEAIIGRLKGRNEEVCINYEGPKVEGLKTGLNELPANLWANWVEAHIGYRALLFSLVRHLKPKVCLELGTVAGLSSIYMAQALALNGQGTLHTLESNDSNYKLCRETLWLVRDLAHLRLGPLQNTLDELLPETGPPDLVFLGGTHTSGDEADHAKRIIGQVNPGALIVFNNVHWSEGTTALWEELRDRPEVGASLDLGRFGLLQSRRSEEGVSAFHFASEVPHRPGVRKLPSYGIEPENLTWIFGSPRSGTTWLRDIMRTVGDAEVWEEPFVGDLFGHFYYERAQKGQLQAQTFIMGEPLRAAWIQGIRQFLLEVGKGRFPQLKADTEVVVKEPSGSIGAPLLLEAFPESRMVLLIRDPRDVVASYLDASQKGSWLYNRRDRGWIRESEYADQDPDTFVKLIAREYAQHVGNALKAYDAHPEDRKALIRYEDLTSDTSGVVRSIYSNLGRRIENEDVAMAVQKHAWENISEDKKGEGKFYRKAEPGGWREDLTPGQVEVVERITAPILEEFYGE